MLSLEMFNFLVFKKQYTTTYLGIWIYYYLVNTTSLGLNSQKVIHFGKHNLKTIINYKNHK